MDYQELVKKEKSELAELLASKREELREVRFRVARGEEKKVRRVRVLRQEIARLLTALRKKR